MSNRAWSVALLLVGLAYVHNALPYLTTLPRVNVDEPWLMERGFQVMRTGVPSQPMLGLQTAYLLQVGYGYLLALWMSIFGVGLLQARLLSVCLGGGILAMVAAIGRRAADPVTGAVAALFLALDSNFLGGVRDARTDIPSVFFGVAALAAYVRGRRQSRGGWFFLAGASLGVAMLCHGNAFWVGLIMLAWYLVDYGRQSLSRPFGYSVLAGWLTTFGPYLGVVAVRWTDVRQQIANFAADRVPGVQPSFIFSQVLREPERYRDWYFGLVTATVPNPLLRAFQVATVAGLAALAYRSVRPRTATADDPRGPLRLLILAVGGAAIFATLINNKVPVYMPHLLIGFALAAGFAISESVALAPARTQTSLALILVAGYGFVGTAYYEKWYARERKGELVSYEQTEATLRTSVPAGPKYVYASPQFWTPFHADAGVRFYSYTAAHPFESRSSTILSGASDDRPIVLVVDEYQWLPELVGVTSSTEEWQRTWIEFIERHCALEAIALGTSHGTLATYECRLGSPPPPMRPRLVGGTTTYEIGRMTWHQTAEDLGRWARYDDPRRTAADAPAVGVTPRGLEISGTGWPGIVAPLVVSPHAKYLVRTTTTRTRDGDLLYLGTWQQPEVLSLGGAASAGVAAALHLPAWFPSERAFEATAPDVRTLVYSEARPTDFLISSLDVYELHPVAAEARH